MKFKVIFILFLFMGLFQSVFSQSNRSIDIVNSHLVRVEPHKGDYLLVFEIDCRYKGVKECVYAFAIVPLDEDFVVALDSKGDPLMAIEAYEMTENTGSGVIEISVPMSLFPQNDIEHSYACMIIDDETLETVADNGPFSFTNKDVKQLLSKKAINTAMDFFDFLLGGGGSGGIFGTDEDSGKSKCHVCNGNKVCITCDGRGVGFDDKKCITCNGTGKCHHCLGKGTM